MSEKYSDEKYPGYKPGFPVGPAFSLNNRLILEPRNGDKSLTATVNSGFATVRQKESLIGLKVLVDADVTQVNRDTCRAVRKGDIAYIREEYFYTEEGSKKPFSCDAIEGKFIIVNAVNVEFIQPK